MSTLRTAVVIVLLGGTVGQPIAISQSIAPREQAYASTATAIMVDVVVRDRRGRPLLDLSAEDFSISEDGVRQEIGSFTRVSRGGGIGVGIAWRTPVTTVSASPSPRPSDAAPTPDEELATTALVFDRLSAETLKQAQRATLEYVPMSGDSGPRIAVFATDPGFRVLQRFTNDRSQIRRAVDRLLPSGTSAAEQSAERAERLIARRRELQTEGSSLVAQGGSGNSQLVAQNAAAFGQRESELRLVETELNMIRSFDNLDRDSRGYESSTALLAVIDSLSLYPGRKTLVFFSEGLPVSPVLSARLDRVIEAANRANITAYVVDAQGLRAKSSLTVMRKEMEAFADDRFTQLASASDRTQQPMTMAFERVEDTLRLDSRVGMARLAEETGGFLVDGSNDLTRAFRRIDEDNQFHYLLTYSPSNTTFDGRFRRIDVKVRRPDAQIFARKGYRAVRMPAGAAGRSFEAPALALLDRGPLANAFPVRAAAFSFPDPDRPGLVPLLVSVRTDNFRYDLDAQRGTYSGQLSIVVRLRDGSGREVDKLSQQYLLTGELKDLEAARRGDILFYREIDLGPGIYTMESVVYDAVAQQGSARIGTITVPPADPSAPGMSSLILVARAEDSGGAAAAPGPRGPLYVGTSLLYPNLGEPIRKSSPAELPFYFMLYGRVGAVSAVAQLLRNGDLLAEAPVQLPASTGSRMQHVGRLPIAALPLGTYELRIRVTGAGPEISRTAFFTIQE
jgi:VWFA-related protein